MSPAKKKTAKKPAATGTLSAEEKAALRETVRERKAAAKGEDGLKTLLAKIAEMPPHDRKLAQRIHEIVSTHAPGLMPKTWYGMPAYTNAEGKVVCFFQSADKFKARYASLGFDQAARLDEGNMWATSFALKDLSAADEERITALVKKAVG